MNLTADRKLLADAAKAAARFLPRHTAIPALTHLRIEAMADGTVAISATDHEAGRRVEIEAQVEVEGAVLVPASFPAVVAGGTGETAKLTADDSHLTVSVGRGRNKLRIGRIDDYPDEPEVEGDKVTVESWERLRALARIAPTNGKRPNLEGVHLSDGTAAVTDSYRLAWAEFTDQADHPEANIPARSILGLDADVTAVTTDGRRVRADVDDGAWWARLIEGAFPKWRSLVDQAKGQAVASFVVDSEELADVIARAGLVIDIHTFPLRFVVADGEVEVSGKQNDRGEFTESIPVKADGDKAEATFNGSFLRSVVEPVASVTIEVADGFRPATITGGDWWNALIMPVRP